MRYCYVPYEMFCRSTVEQSKLTVAFSWQHLTRL